MKHRKPSQTLWELESIYDRLSRITGTQPKDYWRTLPTREAITILKREVIKTTLAIKETQWVYALTVGVSILKILRLDSGVVSLTLSIRTRLTFRTHQGEENVLTVVKDIPQENTISLILLPLQNCQSYKELMTLCLDEHKRKDWLRTKAYQRTNNPY